MSLAQARRLSEGAGGTGPGGLGVSAAQGGDGGADGASGALQGQEGTRDPLDLVSDRAPDRAQSPEGWEAPGATGNGPTPQLKSIPADGVGAVPLAVPGTPREVIGSPADEEPPSPAGYPWPAPGERQRVPRVENEGGPGLEARPAPPTALIGARERSASLYQRDRGQRRPSVDLFRGRSRASSMARAAPPLLELQPAADSIPELSTPSERGRSAAPELGPDLEFRSGRSEAAPPAEPVSPQTQRAREELAFGIPGLDGLRSMDSLAGTGEDAAGRPRLGAALSPDAAGQDGDLFVDPLAPLEGASGIDDADQSETRSETRSETAGTSRGDDPSGAVSLASGVSRRSGYAGMSRRGRRAEGAGEPGRAGGLEGRDGLGGLGGAVSSGSGRTAGAAGEIVGPNAAGDAAGDAVAPSASHASKTFATAGHSAREASVAAEPTHKNSDHHSVSVSKAARQQGPGPDIASCLETLKCSDFEARQEALKLKFTNREIFVPEISDSGEQDQPPRLTMDPARLQYGELYPPYLENSWFFRFNRRGEFKTPMSYSDQGIRVRSCTYKYPAVCGTSELVFHYYVAGDPTNDPVLVIHDFYQSPYMILPFLNQLAAENKCAYCMDTTAVAARTGSQELVVCLCEFLLNVCLHFKAAMRRPSSLVMGTMQETTRRISLIGQGSGANLALKIAVALTILTDGVDSLYDYNFSKSATSRLMRSGLTAVNITTLVTIKSVVLCNPLMPSFLPALKREGRAPYKFLRSLRFPAFVSARWAEKPMLSLLDYLCPFCPDELLAHYSGIIQKEYRKANYVSMHKMSASGQSIFRDDAEYETEVRSTQMADLAGGPVVQAGTTAALAEKEPLAPRRLSTNANLEGLGAREGSIPANVLLAKVADATSTAVSMHQAAPEAPGASGASGASGAGRSPGQGGHAGQSGQAGRSDPKASGLSVEDMRPTGDYNDIVELYNSLTARHKSNLAVAVFLGSENRYMGARDMRRLKYIDTRDSNIFLRTIPAVGQDMLNTCKNLLTKFV